ncbi:MAG: SPOR domain-containing protein [Caldimonas sp.]
MKDIRTRRRQRGGFIIGLVIGLLIGLALALGVALYVTKAPNPFVNKVPPRPAGQDAAEAERNRNWDPNSALAGRNPAPAASASASAPDILPPVAAVRPALVPPTVIDPILPGAASAPRPGRPASATASGAAPAPGGKASQALPVLAGGDPFSYFVQAGAYARSEDAEQQRAKLAMLGVESKLTEREQSGRTVYRVRVGPFERKEEADAAKEKLNDAGVDSALVRVQK